MTKQYAEDDGAPEPDVPPSAGLPHTATRQATVEIKTRVPHRATPARVKRRMCRTLTPQGYASRVNQTEAVLFTTEEPQRLHNAKPSALPMALRAPGFGTTQHRAVFF